MDRDALAQRNQRLAEAFHQTPLKHRFRRYLVQAVARLPFTPLNARVQRVLFIRPDHIGDLLLATPAIRALKNARPFTEVHVLCGTWSAPILANVADVDQALTLRFAGFDREQEKTHPLQPYLQLLRVSRQLRRIGYTSAVIMRPDHWWGAMLAHVAGIKERIGYDLPEVAPFLTRRIAHKREHVVRQNMRLVAHWTGEVADQDVPYWLEVPESTHLSIEERLREWSAQANQLVCIHAGAGTWAKQWEAEKWAQVAQALIEQTDAQIIFTGTSSERALVTQIQNRVQARTINAAGDLSLEQLTALYALARVVVGVDSGPMHIAAAVNTPTVTLFGPADPLEFAAWGDRKKHIVLTSTLQCRPCRVLDWGDDDPAHHPCLREIRVADVLEATRTLLNASRG